MRHWTKYLASILACSLVACLATTAAAAADELEDFDITIAVETELILEDAVPAHKIDVSTDAGIVTLSGSVDSYYAKLEAEATAKTVKGTLAVINNIEVAPLVRTDSLIHSDIIAALAVDSVADSFEIDVTVENGVVTLTGEVDSYTEKTVAEDVAERVKGVVLVNNLLTYDLVTDRLDVDIKKDIQYRLRTDASIDSGLMNVAVDDGTVTLDGSASSAIEKVEAEDEAWMVPGVESVVNNIEVKWWLDSDTADWQDGWTDADMANAIDNALLTNARVMSFNVTATVDDGVATLTGTVDNLEAKRTAEEEAEDVLGVWRVKNYLRVRPETDRTDADIANDIRDALRRDPYVDRYEIAVRVSNGKAFLSGEVDSWYMKDEAGDATAGVPGVIEIQNNLDVDYQYTVKTDSEIKQDIESQLWWSPFVDSDDVSVEVNSGVATLTGTVEDWGELKAAKENARQGGATSVISNLDIENGSGSS